MQFLQVCLGCISMKTTSVGYPQPLALTRLELIGLPYRLGAEPDRHCAADCLTLSRHVLRTYGIDTPTANRSWYRRLRNKDYSIFTEQLDLWGTQTTDIKVGTVALCQTNSGVGLATFINDYPGWLSFIGTEVVWSPVGAPSIERLYCPGKSNSAKR